MSALSLTVGAIVYSTDRPQSAETPGVQATGPRAARLSPANATMRADTRRQQWIATDEDPFAPRAWVAPPPAPVLQRTVAPAVVTDAAPPPPTPLPFQFLGQMSDAGDSVIYLKMGDEVLLARVGAVLEGSYKVVGISPSQIEFESTGSGLRQALPIPAQDN